MKLAGTIALALALILGVWSVADYIQNEQAAKLNAQEMAQEVTRELDGRPPSNYAMEQSDRIKSDEHFDAIIGTLAVAALIGSLALFSKSRPQPSNPS